MRLNREFKVRRKEIEYFKEGIRSNKDAKIYMTRGGFSNYSEVKSSGLAELSLRKKLNLEFDEELLTKKVLKTSLLDKELKAQIEFDKDLAKLQDLNKLSYNLMSLKYA